MIFVKNLSIALLSATLMVIAASAKAKALSLSYDTSIGSPGFAPGQLFVTQGIAVNNAGNVFVSNGRGVNPDGTANYNIGDTVNIYSPTGNYLGAIGSGGTGPGQFDEPSTLDFSPQTGDLYVGDVYNNRIEVFNPQGQYISSFAQGLFSGLKPGRAFFGPSGMAFDNTGNFYVGNFSGDEIYKFTANGQLLSTIGSTGTGLGQFQGVAGVAISPVNGDIVASDQLNNRVQVLDPNGKALFAFGTEGSGTGQFNQPIGVSIDNQGNIYVADSVNSRVEVFDQNGKFLTSYGQPALDASGKPVPPPALTDPPFGKTLDLTPGKFNWTGGTALKDGKLYVGDFFQGRVQVLNVDNSAAKVPEPSPAIGLLAISALAAASTLKRKRNQELCEKLLDEVEVL